MCYGLGIHGIKIASNTYDEVPNHPFTIKEFKTIYDVLKHKTKKKEKKSWTENILTQDMHVFS